MEIFCGDKVFFWGELYEVREIQGRYLVIIDDSGEREEIHPKYLRFHSKSQNPVKQIGIRRGDKVAGGGIIKNIVYGEYPFKVEFPDNVFGQYTDVRPLKEEDNRIQELYLKIERLFKESVIENIRNDKPLNRGLAEALVLCKEIAGEK